MWSCVVFEERFTLCFKVVGEFLNVEIYVLVFFSRMLIPGLGLFSVCDDVQNSVCFLLAAPSLISISHIVVAKRYCNEKICVSSRHK